MTNNPVSERELVLGILLEVTEHGGYSHLVLRAKSLGVKPAHDGLVEIVYQCSKQKKDSILRHE